MKKVILSFSTMAMLFVLVSLAQAQVGMPSNFKMTLGTPEPTGVQVTMTWGASATPNATYNASGAYNTNNEASFSVALPATARSFTRLVVYHSSGKAEMMWGCIAAVSGGVNSENSCASILIPAKGSPETIEVAYKEPTTNADGTPLTDLAKTTVYGRVGSEAVLTLKEVPSLTTTGGQDKSVTFTAPATTGQLSVWVTATDTLGNESQTSPQVTKLLGVPKKGTITLQTITQ